MIDKVVPCYPTHGEGHSAFYKGYHRNDNLPRFPICNDLFCGTISQTHFLGYMVFLFEKLYFKRGIYQTLESTHLS